MPAAPAPPWRARGSPEAAWPRQWALKGVGNPHLLQQLLDGQVRPESLHEAVEDVLGALELLSRRHAGLRLEGDVLHVLERKAVRAGAVRAWRPHTASRFWALAPETCLELGQAPGACCEARVPLAQRRGWGAGSAPEPPRMRR